MDRVNEFVLESEVVILTGGVDHCGIPLITIPTDSVDLVDIYGAGDILRLLQLFVHIAGGKVAVLADLRHGWTQDCITKLTVILDELQMSLRQCITTFYLVKPRLRAKQKFLQRELSRKYGPGRMVPFYKVQRVESHEELYDYVDQSQLTKDYGGSLCYDHTAWMDFQKRYTPVIKAVENLLNAMPAIQDVVTALIKSVSDRPLQSGDICRKEVTAKYEAILSKRNVRDIVERCEQALVDIETPDNDMNTSKIHASLLVNTTAKLRELNNEITKNVADMDSHLGNSKNVNDIRARLKTCRENAHEVTDTIVLLNEHVKELPRIGQTITEAYEYRQQFIEEVLKPSKEVVSCSTLILKQLDTGKETTPKSYAIAFGIAKELTKALQPFSQDVNELNDTYTRLHLFFVLMGKVRRWKAKASEFMIKHLQSTTPNNESIVNCGQTVKSKAQLRVSFDDTTVTALDTQGGNVDVAKDKINTQYGDQKMVFEFSDKWPELLEKFFRKHPPPRKRHLRLLTKNLPTGIKRCLKTNANNLVERTIFILAVLEKSHFKVEDISLIARWQRELARTDTTETHTQRETDVTRV